MTSITQRSNNRNETILDVAAEQFSKNGFHETSIRDIAKAVGMLPGSIYYHYSSKDDLLLAVYEIGVNDIIEKFTVSVNSVSDPWDKLSSAIGAHIGAITRNNPYMKVINRVLPNQVIKHKFYSRIYVSLMKNIFVILLNFPLKKSINKDLLRLMILGSANHSQFWYNEYKGFTPEEIGKKFSQIIIDPIYSKEESLYKSNVTDIEKTNTWIIYLFVS